MAVAIVSTVIANAAGWLTAALRVSGHSGLRDAQDRIFDELSLRFRARYNDEIFAGTDSRTKSAFAGRMVENSR